MAIRSLLSVLVLLSLPATTWAAAVEAGETVQLSGTSASERPEIGGAILDQISFDFGQTDAAGTLLFSGTMEVRLRGSVGNAEDEAAAGDVTEGVFSQEYRIASFSAAASGFRVAALRTEPVFTSERLVDVDFRLDEAPGVNPEAASWDGSGTRVDFGLGEGAIDGERSSWMFVASGNDLAAPPSMAGAYLVISDGDRAYQVPFPSFSLFIPLPGSIWLLLTGLSGLGVLARARRPASIARMR